MEVFLVSAIPIVNKKASQPLRISFSNFLFLARLFSTRGHSLSSCKKVTRISKTSALQRVGDEERNYTCVCVCVCVCEHMCTHIHVCDQWTVTQLHIPFEGEVGMLNYGGIRCSIIIVHCVD